MRRSDIAILFLIGICVAGILTMAVYLAGRLE